MLGKLAALGYGPDRIVPVAFHVDYFNDPWRDPLSDPAHSQREMAYNTVLKRKDLYFTPMMMVDGQTPMLGSDQTKALAALRQSVKEPPGVALGVKWAEGEGPGRKSLRVTVSALAKAVTNRELLIGAALFEEPVSTLVPSGENGGKTLVEHFAVRKFQYQRIKLTGPDPQPLTFPVVLDPKWDASRSGVAVFVQDWDTGRVYQAESAPWEAAKARK